MGNGVSDRGDNDTPASGKKSCVICGLNLEGKPRVKDARGRYFCKSFAETREHCGTQSRRVDAEPRASKPESSRLEPASLEPLAIEPESNEPDSFQADLGIASLVEAEARAQGEMASLALAPEEPERDRNCPVCARSFAPGSASCAGCGFRRDLGIKSSMLLKKAMGTHGMTVLCSKCGYDMGSGTSLNCAECGSKAKLQSARTRDEDRAAAIAREAYLRPLITLGSCLAVMVLIVSLVSGGAGLIPYGIEYGVTLVLGYVIYTGLCVVSLGFDAPQHLVLLRLGAVYAASDVAFMVAGFIPFPLLPWIFALLTYISLLMYFLECEMSEALIIIAATFFAKVVGVVLIAAWLIGML